MINEISIGDRWKFKHSKIFIKIFDIKSFSKDKIINYGNLNSKSGHISSSKKSFLNNYERVEK